jgi:hypothetical protein
VGGRMVALGEDELGDHASFGDGVRHAQYEHGRGCDDYQ